MLLFEYQKGGVSTPEHTPPRCAIGWGYKINTGPSCENIQFGQERSRKEALIVKCDSEQIKWDIANVSRHLKYLNDKHEGFPITVTKRKTR